MRIRECKDALSFIVEIHGFDYIVNTKLLLGICQPKASNIFLFLMPQFGICGLINLQGKQINQFLYDSKRTFYECQF